ncbi:MAG: hypothetical protein E7673_02425 [Ruminococcaceae bacterium]|nr:hypothetical protein [Oscillospiraceae bacterium]
MKKKLLTILMVVLAISCVLTSCLRGQKKPESIEVDKTTIKTEYKLNETPDFSGIKVTVKYNDDSTEVIGADKLTVGTVDTATAGTKKLTVTYEGITVTVDITVKGESINDEEQQRPEYIIMGAELPASLTTLDGKKVAFRDKTQGYVVGDDNAYVLTLDITVLNSNNELVDTVKDYVSASKVYLIEGETATLLEGESIAAYVAIDENKNSFDFTEAAIGKTFKIVTRPASNLGVDEADATCEHVVTVVDGYNIYDAKELNFITNDTDAEFGLDDEFKQVEIVDAFLAANGLTRPEKLAGVVLHGDIVLTKNDIPAGYITPASAGTAAGYLYDFMMVYRHMVTKDVPTFSIYGNYYTIDSKNLPKVPPKDDAYNGDGISNTALFMFTVDQTITDTRNDDGTAKQAGVEADAYKSYNPADYVTNVINLAMRDNEPNSNLNADDFLDAAKRGLLGFKTRFHTVNITNTRVEAFMLSLLTDYDHQVVNLNKVDFYNAWQNHIFASSKNLLWERNNASDIAPSEVYYQPTINIIDSRVAKCGGPVIISQTDDLEDASCAKSANVINIDDKSDVYSYVNGSEAWFVAYGVKDIATMILGLSTHIENVGKLNGLNAGFVTKVGDTIAMNLIMANMPSGSGLTMGGPDVDGKLTIGGDVVMNMNDGENPVVDAYLTGIKAMMNKDAPVFQTSAGGTCASDGAQAVFGVDFSGGMENVKYGVEYLTPECFQGKYITLYYNGISISFEYFVTPMAQ